MKALWYPALLAFGLVVFISFRAEAQAPEGKEVHCQLISADDGEPIPRVICRTIRPGGRYGSVKMTDNEGHLVIRVRQTDSLVLLGKLGYKTLRFTASSFAQQEQKQIRMQPDTIMLAEVGVMPAPVKQRNDTVRYDVRAFKGKQDHYIEQVLKRLPGIEVNKEGNISYQGKSISALYIDGINLLDGRYNIATRNLPVDAVSSVNVLEHHQNTKVLRGKVFEEKAAIDLRLTKKFRARLFGEASLSGGASAMDETASLLAGESLFAALIQARRQSMATVKANNAGINLTEEVEEHLTTGQELAYHPAPLPFLKSASFFLPPVPERSYLRNKSLLGTLNHAWVMDEENQFKLHLVALTDKQRQRDENEYLYSGKTPFRYFENNYLSEQNRVLKPSITYEHNGEAFFFSNQAKFTYDKSRQEQSTEVDAAKNLQLRMQNSSRSGTNYLRLIKSAGKSIWILDSYTQYLNKREPLAVEQGNKMDFLAYERENWGSWNKFQTAFHLGKMGIGTSVVIDWERRKYLSKMANDLEDSFVLSKAKVGLSTVFSYDFSFARIHFDLPVAWEPQKLEGQQKVLDRDYRSLTFTPTVLLRKVFNSHLSARTSVSYSNKPYEFSYYVSQALMRDHRHAFVGLNKLFRVRALRTTAVVNYKKFESMYFANLMLTYVKTTNPVYLSHHYSKDRIEERFLEGVNVSERLFCNFNFDKTFYDTGFSIRPTINYDRMKRSSFISDRLTDIQLEVLTGVIKLSYNKLSWLELTYESIVNYLSNRSKKVHNKVLGMKHVASAIFKVNARLGGELQWQYDSPDLKRSASDYHFLNAALRYKISKKTFVNAELYNLFNHQSYEVYNLSNLNEHRYSFPLRGRECYVSFGFSF